MKRLFAFAPLLSTLVLSLAQAQRLTDGLFFGLRVRLEPGSRAKAAPPPACGGRRVGEQGRPDS